MLRESHCVAQADGEPYRRWFFDEQLDLLVWFDGPHGQPIGFQLRYGAEEGQRVLTRWPTGRICHKRIDVGERVIVKPAPLLARTRDGYLVLMTLRDAFLTRAERIDDAIYWLVIDSIETYRQRVA